MKKTLIVLIPFVMLACDGFNQITSASAKPTEETRWVHKDIFEPTCYDVTLKSDPSKSCYFYAFYGNSEYDANWYYFRFYLTSDMKCVLGRFRSMLGDKQDKVRDHGASNAGNGWVLYKENAWNKQDEMWVRKNIFNITD